MDFPCFAGGKMNEKTVLSFLQREVISLSKIHLKCITLPQTDCRWCLQSGIAMKAIPSCLNGQSRCAILCVMSESNLLAGTVCPKLIDDACAYLMWNIWWKMGRMMLLKSHIYTWNRDLISILMQNSDYTLSVVPQGRTFNEKRAWPSSQAESSFHKNFTISIQS